MLVIGVWGIALGNLEAEPDLHRYNCLYPKG